MKIFFYPFLLVLAVQLYSMPAQAQDIPGGNYDSNYIRTYDTMFTSRIYFSQKYVDFKIRDNDTSQSLRYWPHTKFAAGLGVTYGWFTLNLSVGVGYINPKYKDYDKSKAWDLQMHAYGPRVAIDFLGQYYKGYFLNPKGLGSGNSDTWYTLPEMSMLQVGVSAFYAFNWRKFSYRAAYLQSSWQVKSAGSFLVGMDLFYENVKNDSGFVPAALKRAYASADVTRVEFGDFGPGAGYAYTLVIAKHFFISGVVTGTLSVNLLSEERGPSSENTFAFNPNYALKGAIGYNSRRLSVSYTWAHNSLLAKGESANYTIHAGNPRLHIAYRFLASDKATQKLKLLQRFPFFN